MVVAGEGECEDRQDGEVGAAGEVFLELDDVVCSLRLQRRGLRPTSEFVEFEGICDGEEEELVGNGDNGRYSQVVIV